MVNGLYLCCTFLVLLTKVLWCYRSHSQILPRIHPALSSSLHKFTCYPIRFMHCFLEGRPQSSHTVVYVALWPCVVFFPPCLFLHHPLPSRYRAWPCLVWSWQGVCQRTVKPLVAGQSSAESQSAVMDSSRSSCTCHWLSSRLSELGKEEGQTGKCVCLRMCVWGLEFTSGRGLGGLGHWLGCHCCMDCVCVKERMRGEGKGGTSVSSSWVREQVLVYVSQAPWISSKKHNTSLDSFPLPALICFCSIHGEFG